MPNGKPRFLGLQILRGLAALLVVFHHEVEAAPALVAGTPIPRALLNGAFGVDLFFPISGFVMFLTASSLLRRAPAGAPVWRDFAWRRIVRVVPLYWLCTTLKLLLYFAVPGAMLHFRLRPANVIASYLFLPTLGPEHTPLPVLPVGWTLNFEMAFYLLVAIALAFRLPLFRFLAITIGVLSIFGFLMPQSWGAPTYLADPIQLEFLGGLALGLLLTRIQTVPAWIPALLLPCSLAFALLYREAALVIWSHSRCLIWGIPGVLIVFSVLALEKHLTLHRQRFLLLLGDASYSLYLAHTFVLPGIGLLLRRLHLHGAMGLALLILVNTVACVASGILVHLCVELPLLNLLSRHSVPWSTRSAEAA